MAAKRTRCGTWGETFWQAGDWFVLWSCECWSGIKESCFLSNHRWTRPIFVQLARGLSFFALVDWRSWRRKHHIEPQVVPSLSACLVFQNPGRFGYICNVSDTAIQCYPLLVERTNTSSQDQHRRSLKIVVNFHIFPVQVVTQRKVSLSTTSHSTPSKKIGSKYKYTTSRREFILRAFWRESIVSNNVGCSCIYLSTKLSSIPGKACFATRRGQNWPLCCAGKTCPKQCCIWL